MSLWLNNARLVLPDAVVLGGIRVSDGLIAAIETGSPANTSGGGDAIDCGGDYLLPGLIELHSDNLEKHLMPRAGVLWPAIPSLIAHDAQLAAAGITTVLDAMAVGDLEGDDSRTATLGPVCEVLLDPSLNGLLRCEHLLHLRCELAYPALLSTLMPLLGHPLLRLLSLMDHTPGQRQYRDLAQYRLYYSRNQRYWSDEDFDALVTERRQQQAALVPGHRQAIVEQARARGIPLASHDDSTLEEVAESARCAVTLAEFPTTLLAARSARGAGQRVMAGAPNLVRGKSHSGNVGAHTLAEAGLIDILSSDYVPAALLQGVFLLAGIAGWSLPHAVATATLQPAQALGLRDRGMLAAGRRADLVRVRVVGSDPVVVTTYRAGQPVF
ncbi:alpha-D-ribose 1-methylphosphonate 5-triphosphate diphosphatase [Andreprevotia chitinilytica]|uniref:alpha-D-ribose 1-methylphosphonate 5-triphosphate diphosphatase n=1 Tax=Andreprevotia chitinilytica TaxID=396808 RepID=UPI0005589331|nr:alpha-D-ribose 1-methylphosphonate 5-triphosphate diphosphatase [Andreprevotia chitinilytica]